jgi:hypothetical protein
VVDTGCGFSGPQRVFDNFSTYRLGVTPGGVCPQITLIHEIGHNLTLIHADGACTEFDADPASVCESIDPPPDQSPSDTSYVETQGGEFEWRTVMRSSGMGANFFTGGLNNSISSPICNGVCNTEPFEDHDSIGILNQARLIAVNNFIEVVLPIAPPNVNPDIYEEDDTINDATMFDFNVSPGNSFQDRNFEDDNYDFIKIIRRHVNTHALCSIILFTESDNVDMCADVYDINTYQFVESICNQNFGSMNIHSCLDSQCVDYIIGVRNQLGSNTDSDYTVGESCIVL